MLKILCILGVILALTQGEYVNRPNRSQRINGNNGYQRPLVQGHSTRWPAYRPISKRKHHILEPPHNHPFICEASGYHQDLHNCRTYHICEKQKSGGFTQFSYQCNYGFVFSKKYGNSCRLPHNSGRPECGGFPLQLGIRGQGYNPHQHRPSGNQQNWHNVHKKRPNNRPPRADIHDGKHHSTQEHKVIFPKHKNRNRPPWSHGRPLLHEEHHGWHSHDTSHQRPHHNSHGKFGERPERPQHPLQGPPYNPHKPHKPPTYESNESDGVDFHNEKKDSSSTNSGSSSAEENNTSSEIKAASKEKPKGEDSDSQEDKIKGPVITTQAPSRNTDSKNKGKTEVPERTTQTIRHGENEEPHQTNKTSEDITVIPPTREADENHAEGHVPAKDRNQQTTAKPRRESTTSTDIERHTTLSEVTETHQQNENGEHSDKQTTFTPKASTVNPHHEDGEQIKEIDRSEAPMTQLPIPVGGEGNIEGNESHADHDTGDVPDVDITNPTATPKSSTDPSGSNESNHSSSDSIRDATTVQVPTVDVEPSAPIDENSSGHHEGFHTTPSKIHPQDDDEEHRDKQTTFKPITTTVNPHEEDGGKGKESDGSQAATTQLPIPDRGEESKDKNESHTDHNIVDVPDVDLTDPTATSKSSTDPSGSNESNHSSSDSIRDATTVPVPTVDVELSAPIDENSSEYHEGFYTTPSKIHPQDDDEEHRYKQTTFKPITTTVNPHEEGGGKVKESDGSEASTTQLPMQDGGEESKDGNKSHTDHDIVEVPDVEMTDPTATPKSSTDPSGSNESNHSSSDSIRDTTTVPVPTVDVESSGLIDENSNEHHEGFHTTPSKVHPQDDDEEHRDKQTMFKPITTTVNPHQEDGGKVNEIDRSGAPTTQLPIQDGGEENIEGNESHADHDTVDVPDVNMAEPPATPKSSTDQSGSNESNHSSTDSIRDATTVPVPTVDVEPAAPIDENSSEHHEGFHTTPSKIHPQDDDEEHRDKQTTFKPITTTVNPHQEDGGKVKESDGSQALTTHLPMHDGGEESKEGNESHVDHDTGDVPDVEMTDPIETPKSSTDPSESNESNHSSRDSIRDATTVQVPTVDVEPSAPIDENSSEHHEGFHTTPSKIHPQDDDEEHRDKQTTFKPITTTVNPHQEDGGKVKESDGSQAATTQLPIPDRGEESKDKNESHTDHDIVDVPDVDLTDPTATSKSSTDPSGSNESNHSSSDSIRDATTVHVPTVDVEPSAPIDENSSEHHEGFHTTPSKIHPQDDDEEHRDKQTTFKPITTTVNPHQEDGGKGKESDGSQVLTTHLPMHDGGEESKEGNESHVDHDTGDVPDVEMTDPIERPESSTDPSGSNESNHSSSDSIRDATTVQVPTVDVEPSAPIDENSSEHHEEFHTTPSKIHPQDDDEEHRDKQTTFKPITTTVNPHQEDGGKVKESDGSQVLTTHLPMHDGDEESKDKNESHTDHDIVDVPDVDLTDPTATSKSSTDPSGSNESNHSSSDSIRDATTVHVPTVDVEPSAPIDENSSEHHEGFHTTPSKIHPQDDDEEHRDKQTTFKPITTTVNPHQEDGGKGKESDGSQVLTTHLPVHDGDEESKEGNESHVDHDTGDVTDVEMTDPIETPKSSTDPSGSNESNHSSSDSIRDATTVQVPTVDVEPSAPIDENSSEHHEGFHTTPSKIHPQDDDEEHRDKQTTFKPITTTVNPHQEDGGKVKESDGSQVLTTHLPIHDGGEESKEGNESHVDHDTGDVPDVEMTDPIERPKSSTDPSGSNESNHSSSDSIRDATTVQVPTVDVEPSAPIDENSSEHHEGFHTTPSKIHPQDDDEEHRDKQTTFKPITTTVNPHQEDGGKVKESDGSQAATTQLPIPDRGEESKDKNESHTDHDIVDVPDVDLTDPTATSKSSTDPSGSNESNHSSSDSIRDATTVHVPTVDVEPSAPIDENSSEHHEGFHTTPSKIHPQDDDEEHRDKQTTFKPMTTTVNPHQEDGGKGKESDGSQVLTTHLPMHDGGEESKEGNESHVDHDTGDVPDVEMTDPTATPKSSTDASGSNESNHSSSDSIRDATTVPVPTVDVEPSAPIDENSSEYHEGFHTTPSKIHPQDDDEEHRDKQATFKPTTSTVNPHQEDGGKVKESDESEAPTTQLPIPDGGEESNEGDESHGDHDTGDVPDVEMTDPTATPKSSTDSSGSSESNHSSSDSIGDATTVPVPTVDVEPSAPIDENSSEYHEGFHTTPSKIHPQDDNEEHRDKHTTFKPITTTVNPHQEDGGKVKESDGSQVLTTHLPMHDGGEESKERNESHVDHDTGDVPDVEMTDPTATPKSSTDASASNESNHSSSDSIRDATTVPVPTVDVEPSAPIDENSSEYHEGFHTTPSKIHPQDDDEEHRDKQATFKPTTSTVNPHQEDGGKVKESDESEAPTTQLPIPDGGEESNEGDESHGDHDTGDVPDVEMTDPTATPKSSTDSSGSSESNHSSSDSIGDATTVPVPTVDVEPSAPIDENSSEYHEGFHTTPSKIHPQDDNEEHRDKHTTFKPITTTVNPHQEDGGKVKESDGSQVLTTHLPMHDGGEESKEGNESHVDHDTGDVPDVEMTDPIETPKSSTDPSGSNESNHSSSDSIRDATTVQVPTVDVEPSAPIDENSSEHHEGFHTTPSKIHPQDDDEEHRDKQTTFKPITTTVNPHQEDGGKVKESDGSQVLTTHLPMHDGGEESKEGNESHVDHDTGDVPDVEMTDPTATPKSSTDASASNESNHSSSDSIRDATTVPVPTVDVEPSAPIDENSSEYHEGFHTTPSKIHPQDDNEEHRDKHTTFKPITTTVNPHQEDGGKVKESDGSQVLTTHLPMHDGGEESKEGNESHVDHDTGDVPDVEMTDPIETPKSSTDPSGSNESNHSSSDSIRDATTVQVPTVDVEPSAPIDENSSEHHEGFHTTPSKIHPQDDDEEHRDKQTTFKPITTTVNPHQEDGGKVKESDGSQVLTTHLPMHDGGEESKEGNESHVDHDTGDVPDVEMTDPTATPKSSTDASASNESNHSSSDSIRDATTVPVPTVDVEPSAPIDENSSEYHEGFHTTPSKIHPQDDDEEHRDKQATFKPTTSTVNPHQEDGGKVKESDESEAPTTQLPIPDGGEESNEGDESHGDHDTGDVPDVEMTDPTATPKSSTDSSGSSESNHSSSDSIGDATTVPVPTVDVEPSAPIDENSREYHEGFHTTPSKIHPQDDNEEHRDKHTTFKPITTTVNPHQEDGGKVKGSDGSETSTTQLPMQDGGEESEEGNKSHTDHDIVDVPDVDLTDPTATSKSSTDPSGSNESNHSSSDSIRDATTVPVPTVDVEPSAPLGESSSEHHEEFHTIPSNVPDDNVSDSATDTAIDNVIHGKNEMHSTLSPEESGKVTEKPPCNGNELPPSKPVCSKAGYLPDPTDCAKYYYCLELGVNLGFRIFNFNCGLGTIWDQEISSCNRPMNVKRIMCKNHLGTSHLGDDAASDNVPPETDILPLTPEVLPPDTEKPLREVNCPLANKNGSVIALICPTGFKRHPKFYNLFYQCTNTVRPVIAILTCPDDYVFVENRQECVSKFIICRRFDCPMYDSTSMQAPSDKILRVRLGRLCPGKGDYKYDGSCSNLFYRCKQATNGTLQGYLYKCPENHIFSPAWNACKPAKMFTSCKRNNNLNRPPRKRGASGFYITHHEVFYIEPRSSEAVDS